MIHKNKTMKYIPGLLFFILIDKDDSTIFIKTSKAEL